MKEVSRFLMALFAASLLSGCSEETTRKGTDDPLPGENSKNERHEVMLTLNNELVLKKTATRAPGDAPIATTEENAIASLDVYVFGSTTENGDYTFQERFAYRADEDAILPVGATAFELAVDATKKESTGLLKLKKGLYVKLYCIANNEELINPATKQIVNADDFVPLTFTNPGEAGTGVAVEGTPRESEFLTFHTPLLEANEATDVLQTPLVMAGSYTIPVDLTDFETSARLQLGFKLTRLAARFDIVNKADESHFTITEVSMGNGRRGATFFPIHVYGQASPPQPGELITLPARKFDGTEANKGTQTGAFYSYPSPVEDGGFLILRGKYRINATEEKEVSYQIPFTQNTDDGNGITLDINNNHRYTIGITKADNYHLDFTLTVADWTDSGNIGDYTPGGGKTEITVDVPTAYQGKTTYDANTRSVSMYIKEEASNFDLIVKSTSPLVLQRSYAGGIAAREYDWLVVKDNSVAGLTEYTYNLSPVKGYTKNRYPKAVLRFMNLTDGTENVVFVDAQAAPYLNTTPQPVGSFNSFVPETATVSMYKTTGSQVKVRLSCPNGVTLDSKPDWLDATPSEVSDEEATYTFTLNDRETTDTNGTITFSNSKITEWKTDLTVELKDALVNANFTNVDGGTGNALTPSSGNTPADVAMNIVETNSFNVGISTLGGTSISITYEAGSSNWLTYSDMGTKAVSNTLKFSLRENELAKGTAKKATVTIKNLSGGPDDSFTVTPKYQKPEISLVTSSASPTQNSFSGTTLKLYQVSASQIKIKTSSLGGSKILSATGVTVTGENSYASENIYTINWDETTTSGSGSLIVANNADESQKTTISVNLPSAAITASNTSISAANSGSTNISVTAPEGCTAAVLSNNWNGGGQWFTISKNSTSSNTENITLTQSDNTSKIMKAVTVRLTNKILGGAYKDITITPTNFQAPTLSSTSGTLENVKNVSTSLSFTLTPSAGSYEYTGISNSNIATVSQNGKTFTVVASHAGKTYINFRNQTDNSKTVSYTINVTIDYNGKPVWKVGPHYVAPEDISGYYNVGWNESIRLNTACNGVAGGWKVPDPTVWMTMTGGGYNTSMNSDRFNYCKNNNVFSVGSIYWGSPEGGASAGYGLTFNTYNAVFNMVDHETTKAKIRCVK